jgi:hypothetical protein
VRSSPPSSLGYVSKTGLSSMSWVNLFAVTFSSVFSFSRESCVSTTGCSGSFISCSVFSSLSGSTSAVSGSTMFSSSTVSCFSSVSVGLFVSSFSSDSGLGVSS